MRTAPFDFADKVVGLRSQAAHLGSLRLEWLTIGWMAIEAIVATAAGVASGSLVLVAFGLDSVVELISAGVVIWRLSVELRGGHAFSENAERIASQIGGALLIALAAYVV